MVSLSPSYFNAKLTTTGALEVDRAVEPVSLKIDESKLADPEAYPLTVELRHLDDEEAIGNASSSSGLWRSNAFDLPDSQTGTRANGIVAPGERETVHAKYVIGCDGARSWTREQLGYKLEGDSANVYVRLLSLVG